MERSWQYPLFLIRHETGYASIVDRTTGSETTQSLVACQHKEDAIAFIMRCGIVGVPRELRNDREFNALLRSLKPPVMNVVFDPCPHLGAEADHATQIGVGELLEQYLVVDYSPWNYPVFVVAQESGFVSIDGRDQRGQPIAAVGVFPDEQRVSSFLEAARQPGTPCPLATMQEARTFLTKVASQVVAVAWNPTVEDNRYVAEHCFTIETLLRKYLVVADRVSQRP